MRWRCSDSRATASFSQELDKSEPQFISTGKAGQTSSISDIGLFPVYQRRAFRRRGDAKTTCRHLRHTWTSDITGSVLIVTGSIVVIDTTHPGDVHKDMLPTRDHQPLSRSGRRKAIMTGRSQGVTRCDNGFVKIAHFRHGHGDTRSKAHPRRMVIVWIYSRATYDGQEWNNNN
ncbi:hypothetical protein F5148DRAFT_207334 [Russula earlei]|uniref:Uncharacterized protein n=1 Tax=Russula earlei TaxID=71964 RepID=A0ACC0U4T7_9AGAM|nr:hypothetical protein F5148DRAFT_207334 [Russula earlei]